MKKLLKWGLIIFAVIVVIDIVYIAVTGNKLPENSGQSIVTPIVEQSPVPTTKPIAYEVLQRWEINNGGRGMAVLIPKEFVNETDMTALGQKLKEDLKKDKNNFVMVFTDKVAAKLRDKVASGTLTKAEEEIYDNNYVGQYTKNGNSGLHTFVIYFDGVTGKNSKSIIY